MLNINTARASAVLAGALFCMAAGAASFDCAKASSHLEKAICASPTLSKLDSELADAYGVAALTHADAESLKSDQRAWLRETRNKCADEACLETVYKQRIVALRGLEPVGTPSRAETEADDAKMPSEQQLAEREQIRLQKEQAAKARAEELAAKAKAETEAAAAAELAKKQKEEAEIKKAAQVKRIQLYAAIGVSVFIAIGVIGWLLVRRHKANSGAVKANKLSSNNNLASQNNGQEAIQRAQQEKLNKQQVEIEALKARLAREAESPSSSFSNQAAMIQNTQNTHSNVSQPPEKTSTSKAAASLDWKEKALDPVMKGVKNPHVWNTLKVALAKFNSLSTNKKAIIGAVVFVLLVGHFAPEGDKSSKITAGQHWAAMSPKEKDLTCKYYLVVSDQYLQEVAKGGDLNTFTKKVWAPARESDIAPGANTVVLAMLFSFDRMKDDAVKAYLKNPNLNAKIRWTACMNF